MASKVLSSRLKFSPSSDASYATDGPSSTSSTFYSYPMEIYPLVNNKVHVLIFVNSFQDSDEEIAHLKRAEAAEVDSRLMENLWGTTLNCEVTVHRNLTAIEMKDLLEKITDLKAEPDYLVVVISTHGGVYAESAIRKIEKRGPIDRKANYKYLKTSQEEAEQKGEESMIEVFLGDDYMPVRERDVKRYFHNTDKNSFLIGKPKFLIFDYCRGNKVDLGFRQKRIKASCDDEGNGGTLLPSVSDVLVVYATHPDFVAWEHMSEGSWLISTIAEVFTEHYKKLDVVSMLTIVNNRMKAKIASIPDESRREVLKYKAMSVFESSLDKFFLLKPPVPTSICAEIQSQVEN